MIYTNPFFSADYPNRGTGFVFAGFNIHENTLDSTPNNSYGWFGPSLLLNNLSVVMNYDFRISWQSQAFGFVNLGGVWVIDPAANQALSPSSFAGACYGSMVYSVGACFFNQFTALIGKAGVAPDFDAGCVGDTFPGLTAYVGNTTTITVGPDLGGDIYDVTVRLQIPGLGIDQTVFKPAFFNVGPSAVVAIEGVVKASDQNVIWNINGLVIEDETPPPPVTFRNRNANASGCAYPGPYSDF